MASLTAGFIRLPLRESGTFERSHDQSHRDGTGSSDLPLTDEPENSGECSRQASDRDYISPPDSHVNLRHITTYINSAVSKVQHAVSTLLRCLREEGKGPDGRGMRAAMLSLQQMKLQGVALQERLSQDPASFESLAPQALTLSSYMGDLENTAHGLLRRRTNSWLNLAVSPRQRSDSEHTSEVRLEQEIHRFKSTLDWAMPVVREFSNMVKAGAYLEKQSMAAQNPRTTNWQQIESRQSTEDSIPPFDERIRQLATRVYHPSKPHRDVPGASAKRHLHIKTSRVMGSATWLIENAQFVSWLYGPTYTVFECHGPEGVGKSVLVSKAIELFEKVEIAHAYFYLGRGKVQTAMGVTLALLEQLCLLVGDIPFSSEINGLRRTYSTKSQASDWSISTNQSRLTKAPQRRLSASFGKAIVPPSISQDLGAGTMSTFKTSATVYLYNLNPGQQRLYHQQFPEQSSLHVQGDVAVNMQTLPDNSVSAITLQSLSGPADISEPFYSSIPQSPVTLTQFIDTITLSQDPPAMKTLFDVLRKTLRKLDDHVVIILDGWDEDNMVDPPSFADLLHTLLKLKCKIFITSHSTQDFQADDTILRMDLSPNLEHRGRWSDVQMFVEDLLQTEQHHQSFKTSPDFISVCAKRVADMSSGMFIKARLYTMILLRQQHLTRENPRNLEKLLELRQPLVTYALRQFRNDSTPVAAPSLALVMWLQLSGKYPLSTEYEDAFQAILDYFMGPSTQKVEYGDVLEKVEPFVTVDHGNNLLHFTSPEIATLVRREFNDTEESMEMQVAIAKAYLDYLQKADFNVGCCDTEPALMELLGKYKFVETAARWGSHCRSILKGSPQDHAFQEHIMDFLHTPNCSLAMQVLLYTNLEHLDRRFENWDSFAEWITTLPKLHILLRLGLEDSVETLLQRDESHIKERDIHESTALHEAAKRGFASAVKILLIRDPELATALDKWGKSSLSYAWENHHTDAFVRLFEAQGNDLWSTDGLIPGNISLNDVVREYCLVKSGLPTESNLNATSISLLKAIQNSQSKVTELLMRFQANLDIVFQDTSLLYAAVERKQDNIAAQLVVAGANPSLEITESNGLKDPILHLVIRKSLRKTFVVLMESGRLDVNVVDASGKTALFAALGGDDEKEASRLARRLMRHGIDVNRVDAEGSHVLHIAASKGFVSIISDIIFSSQLTTAPKDANGYTPAHYASKYGHYQGAVILLAAYGE